MKGLIGMPSKVTKKETAHIEVCCVGSVTYLSCDNIYFEHDININNTRMVCMLNGEMIDYFPLPLLESIKPQVE